MKRLLNYLSSLLRAPLSRREGRVITLMVPEKAYKRLTSLQKQLGAKDEAAVIVDALNELDRRVMPDRRHNLH